MKQLRNLIILFIIILITIVVTERLSGEEITSPYMDWLFDRCAIYDVPPEIAISVAIVESNFKMITSTENWNGSKDVGIFQINSRYVEWFEKALWYDERDFDPYDPYENIEMGIIYLRHLYDYTSNWDKAVRAFHQGLHGLKKDPDKSNAYFVKVCNVLTTLDIKGEL